MSASDPDSTAHYLHAKAESLQSKFDMHSKKAEHHLAEANRVKELLHHYRGVLEDICGSSILDQVATDCEDEPDAPKVRRPEDLKRAVFSGQTLVETLESILKASFEPITLDSAVPLIYETENDLEFRACKNSLASAFSRGVQSGLFERPNDSRGTFTLAGKPSDFKETMENPIEDQIDTSTEEKVWSASWNSS